MALIRLNSFSQTLGMGMELEVILPEKQQGVGVDTKGGWDGREELAALYLLHGTTDDQTIWQRRTSIERYVADKKLAVVMPCTHLAAYTNQQYGYAYFDYIAQEVPALCQTYFPISAAREKNFIGGLSMGGYGALKIGIRCGDRFSHAIGLSAGCDRLSMLPEAALDCDGIEALAARRESMDAKTYQRCLQFFLNFGSPKAFAASKEDNLFNLTRDRVERGAPMPEIFMTCGTEDFALDPNRRYHALLDELGVRHTYYEAPGVHEWAYWDHHIQKALAWLPL
ncbi:MAG: alpha/beta hydrolase [Christensenellales bacterium]|jgi:putative tributyrin esterase